MSARARGSLPREDSRPWKAPPNQEQADHRGSETSDCKQAWDLCQATWKSIVDRYGDGAKATDYAPREWVVVAVWTVSGIVGNGGFEYLFESQLPADPDYQLSLDAFRAIGCKDALAAFEGALRLFPGGIVPHDGEERARVFVASPEEVRTALARRFWDAADAVVANLADFIRREFFASGRRSQTPD